MAQESKYTKKLWDELIADLESGDPKRSVSAFCRRNKINRSTPYLWKDRDEEHARQFARARAACIDAIVDAILDTAYDEDLDPARARIRVDALQKYAAKIDPSRYGDKLGLGGAKELPPLTPGTDTELAARAMAIYNAAKKRKDQDGDPQESADEGATDEQ